MDTTSCRWGILSTAAIAQKNWHSIANSGNGRVVAVASRSVQKAQAFIDQCQSSVPVPHDVRAMGSYEQLLSDPAIDAVYVPLPTALRTEWVIRAANAGKHVLVEKPCGVSAADVQAMIDACEANNVQFMDGVMFMHSARMQAMWNALDDGVSVGEIRRIASQFSFCAPDDWVSSNIRASANLEPAGCLGDLGWYTIRFTLWVMKYQMPHEVRGRILHGIQRSDSPAEVPMEFQGEMHFPGGVSATFYNSFRTENQQWVNISGSKGYLQVNDFVLPFFGSEAAFTTTSNAFVVDGCRFNMEEHTRRTAVPEYSNNMPSAQEANLFRNFAALVLSGRRDSHWPDIALRTQQVLDAALLSARSGGISVYPS